MAKLFISVEDDNIEDVLVDNEFYYLFSRYGSLVGFGNWEDCNKAFYDNENDETYFLEDCDYIMKSPTEDQMKSL